MFIPKDNFEKIHFLNNSTNYLSDGEHIYFKGKKLKNIDYSTFGMLTDWCFYDKNGIYSENYKDVIYKIPFQYSKPVVHDSVFYIIKDNMFVIYYNQVYDFSTKFLYYNVPKELLRKETFSISEISPYVDTNIIFRYNQKLHKINNRLFFNNLQMKVDIKTFKCISSNSNSQYFIDKDFVYHYKEYKGFSILDSISPLNFRKFDSIPELVQDDQFLYFENYKIFNLKNTESIDYIYYKRPIIVPGCGLDRSNHNYTMSYIVKTNDDTWLLNIMNEFDYANSCDKKSVAYRKLSFFERKYINSLNEQKTISLKRVFTSK
jgi:hypothetical protein